MLGKRAQIDEGRKYIDQKEGSEKLTCEDLFVDGGIISSKGE